MKTNILIALSVVVLAAAAFSPPAKADQTIRCKSQNYEYHQCPIDTHGYVRLSRQLSKTDCRQGRNWDYDKRGIWVDDGCSAEFVVEGRHHSDAHKSSSTGEAIAAAAAIALIAAVASSGSDKHDNYHDDNYGHGGHSSYVPGWMIGDFEGYNLQYGSQVSLNISSDGRLRANVDGVHLTGYVNDQRLYVGNAEFYIDRAGDGFNTTQVGDNSNQVHYSRR